MEITNADVIKAQVEKIITQSNETSNSSGQGRGSSVPDEVKGWSWAAFLLNWIWATNNKVWIGMISFVPYLGIVMMFILGAKGREWAWQSRRWESTEEFNRIQKKWSFWAVAISGIMVFLVLLIIVLASLSYSPYALFP